MPAPDEPDEAGDQQRETKDQAAGTAKAIVVHHWMDHGLKEAAEADR